MRAATADASGEGPAPPLGIAATLPSADAAGLTTSATGGRDRSVPVLTGTLDLWRRFLHWSHRLHLSYWAIRGALAAARRLPLGLTYPLARAIGAIVFASWREHREAITDNMRHVLGPRASTRAIRRAARAAYVAYFNYIVEFLRYPYLTLQQLEARVSTSGWEHLDAAMAAGRGGIMVTLHYGAPELAGFIVARRGYRVNAIVESFSPPALDDLIQQQRRHGGLETIPLENPTRRIINALRRNEVLVLLIDRPSPEGVPVQFFGGTVRVPAGPASLALKTGARILPSYNIRQPDNTFVGVIAPAVEYAPTGDRERDIQALTQLTMQAFEEPIRRYPGQWYMFRRMWT